MGKYKAIIFDIGNTLVRTDEAILKAIELALGENGLEFKGREAVKRAFGKSSWVNVETAVKACYDEEGGDGDEEMTRKCFTSFKKIFPREVIGSCKVYPGVRETLAKLKEKGYWLGIFTGFNREEANFFLEQLGLAPFFELVVTVDDAPEPRPDPTALLAALERLGVAKEECLYVGDGIADIQMAKNAGVKMACVKTGVQDNEVLKKEGPDWMVDGVEEMVGVVGL